MKKTLFLLIGIIAAMMFVDSRFAPFLLPVVFAHCDTLDGPVVHGKPEGTTTPSAPAHQH